MGKIKVTHDCNGIEGLKVIEPAVFGDARGYFMETYNYNDFKEAGIDCQFVQDNQSASKKGVLRGLHFQINHPQDKLVRVVSGEVFDVAVDLREGSETFGKWFGIVLTMENGTEYYYQQKIKSSFLYQRILHMALSCCLIMQSSAIRLLISTIQMTRAVFSGMIRQSVLNGQCRKE